MKTLDLVLGTMVTASTVFAANDKSEKTYYEIDTKASKVNWTAKKVTGEHTGYLSVGNGMVAVENKSVVNGTLNIDLNTIVCTDLTDAEWNKKLIGHLKSDDFFSVEKFPNAGFEITSVKNSGNGEFKVTGKLTIKGITNEISFPAKINVDGDNLKATGTAVLDRTKWNIRYGSGKFFQGLGDKMIYDEFDIRFDITAKAIEKELSVN